MAHQRIPTPDQLVEPDRVHRLCYTDPGVFELELKNIFEKTWVYAGHESQVPKPGDYWTFDIGRQPMVLVRDAKNKVHVFYNRCPHRGIKLCASLHGHAENAFACSYHGWRFDLDGRLDSIPHLKGYDGTRLSLADPQFSMAHAPRMASYRGFVFASLAGDGPSLLDWLGQAKTGFDDMCDRSPEGEVEVVPNCYRVMQQSNWKLFLENQLDVSHPMVTHESTGRAALEVEDEIFRKRGERPMQYHMLSAFTWPTQRWNELLQTANYPQGHSVLGGYMALRPKDPDSLEHERLLAKAVGEKRKEEILSVNIHHVIYYPVLSVQSPLQQLRALRPISCDKTLSEIWHFRLKGAPEAIYRRSLWYYNLVNSPATMVNADDLENWNRVQRGLKAEGIDWLSFHRNYGQDEIRGDVIQTREGLSEAPLRNQFRAWKKYMSAQA
ncbi:MAG: ribosomal subunit interface protein [Betaproteobacteria bacterium]|nr:ribosomal subunit interface protein [Betaproteobacteria bacterium]